MKIQILGSGCPACKELALLVEKTATEMSVDFDPIEKVTDMAQIAAFGVMQTPALVVDGKVKSAGKKLGREEIQKLLRG